MTEQKKPLSEYLVIFPRAMGQGHIACGLTYEIRPIESERASAYKVTNETPGATTLKLKSALSGTESKT